METYLLALIPELVVRGIEQAVVFSKGRAELVPESYHLAELSFGGRATEIDGYKGMVRILDKVRPSVVHLHQVYNIGVMQACLERVPMVVHGHDYHYLCPASTFYYKRTKEICNKVSGPVCFPTTLHKHCMTLRPRYALAYYRRVKWFESEARRFAAVVVPSESARQRFLAAGCEAEQVTSLPYFCPVQPLEQPRALPLQPTVLFIGRIRPNKGVDTFIEAFARLPRKVRAVMVGDFTSKSRAHMESRASALGCADQVELSDWVNRDQIQKIFASATVLVFPSIWPETLGIVGIEALASGVPVVASDIGGVREWLLPGQTGLLVTPGSVEDLADGMEKLLIDKVRNRAYGENGIALVQERFSPASHIDRLAGIYRSCEQE